MLIDEIKNTVNIIELADRLGLEVRRSGNNLFVHSIFKTEKTPSLCLYADSNSFVDYSSGERGSVIDFYAGFYNLDFKTALNDLAKMYGIGRSRENIRREAAQPNDDKPLNTTRGSITDDLTNEERYIYDERYGIAGAAEALHEVKHLRIRRNTEVFNELANYCRARGWESGALNYLTADRRLSTDTVDTFKLFHIRNWFEVNNHIKKHFNHNPEQLQKSGLLNDNGNLLFAFHKIIIPYIHNGQIVYLRGRYFHEGNSETDRIKYLGLKNDALGVNTPKRFYNSDVLKTMLPGEKLYIVEGEFDAMVLHQAGFNCIAIPGVGNIPSQKKLEELKKFDIVVLPDGDPAGEIMLNKLIEIFGRVKAKRLPSKDVTDFVKEIT